MPSPRNSNAVAFALYANAAILAGILIVLLGRRGAMVSPVFGDPSQPQIAGGGGIYVMPAQLHPQVWGCYLLDVDHQTLCTYEYRAGEKSLVLTAARNIQYDLQLKNFDTFPAWYDVKKLVEDEQNGQRGEGSKTPQTMPDAK